MIHSRQSLYSQSIHIKQSFLICNTFEAAYEDLVIMTGWFIKQLTLISKKYFLFLYPKIEKEMSHSIKKVFLFSTRFSNFQDTYHLLYYPQMSVFSFYTFEALLHQFLRHRAYKEYLSFSVNPGVSWCKHWICNWAINILLVLLLMRQFYCLIFALSWKPL